MIKVVRILNRLNVGGPTYNVAYLSKYLNPEYQTEILAGHKERYEGSSEYMLQELKVPYRFVPDMYRSISFIKDFKAFCFIRKTLKEIKPDIVHTHAAKAGVLGRLAAHFGNPKPRIVLHTYHGNVFDGYFSPLKTKIFLFIERYLAKRSDAIIAISNQQRDDLENKYQIAPADKIHVVRLGFDLGRFIDENNLKRKQFRCFYRISEDTVVITITGRLTPIKNHRLFVRSYKVLKSLKPDANIKAFIVGDGELMGEIINQCAILGLTYCKYGDDNYEADIIFTSWRKDIDVINAGSDVVALTSLNEGTPVSVIEALASCKAVVATDVGGVKDIIQNNLTGLLSRQSPEDFAARLAELIDDQSLRFYLANTGKQFVIENYSYKRLVKDVELLYESLLFAKRK